MAWPKETKQKAVKMMSEKQFIGFFICFIFTTMALTTAVATRKDTQIYDNGTTAYLVRITQTDGSSFTRAYCFPSLVEFYIKNSVLYYRSMETVQSTIVAGKVRDFAIKNVYQNATQCQ